MQKFLSILLFLQISFNSFAQPVQDSLMYDSTIQISAILEGGQVTQRDLDIGFRLITNDTSYKIVSLMLTYPAKVNGGFGLQELPIYGPVVRVENRLPQLYHIKGGFIAIDRIIVERNGIRFKAKSFIVNVVQ